MAIDSGVRAVRVQGEEDFTNPTSFERYQVSTTRMFQQQYLVANLCLLEHNIIQIWKNVSFDSNNLFVLILQKAHVSWVRWKELISQSGLDKLTFKFQQTCYRNNCANLYIVQGWVRVFLTPIHLNSALS